MARIETQAQYLFALKTLNSLHEQELKEQDELSFLWFPKQVEILLESLRTFIAQVEDDVREYELAHDS